MATCTSCGAAGLVDGARFCHECGAPTAAQCTSCGEAIVPGAKFCSSCGSAQGASAPAAAAPARVQPVAERRVTSVLFGDLVGFTTASENRDQEESRELLSRFFDGCRQVVGRYGGTIEKFIGDAVMAVWGVPTAHEDDAERAVRAGLELTRMVVELGADVGAGDLAMRVGIVTGEVAVTIGAEQQGMVAGDPVNTASRVQSIAAPGEVWVDETTKLLTAGAISYGEVGSHTLKGKAEPVALWSARAVVGASGGTQREDGLEAPFVGRERELRLVRELFHGVADNARAGLLVVDGEPGVGKSRLGWEFFKYIDGLAGTTYWHQGRCLAYGDGIAYWALAEAVRLRLVRLAGRDGDDETPDDSLTQLVADGLAEAVPDEEERAWLAPRVGALLGGGSIGTFAREELFTAWVTFFERVSGGDEVVLMIDDAQHADDGLLAFVEYLLESATFPCLVLLLTRPGLIERRPALATNRRATLLHLGELEQRDMTALVDGLVAGLPAEVCAALVNRAEGIPLYAVETVRSLIDRDLVVPRGGQYVLVDHDVDLALVGAPASLQALVAARLDALHPEERMVVSRGGVLGVSFTLDGVRALCSGVDVDAAVEELLRLQILTRDTNRLSADYGQLRFVQSVVRQVAYGTLSRHDRKAGHLAAARYLEEHVDHATDIDAVIAQHYIDALDAVPDEADAPELAAKAIELLVRAADRSYSLGVPEDAAAHLDTALTHAGDDRVRADLQRQRASALRDAGRYDEAAELAKESAETFDRLGDDVAAARAVAVWARSLAQGGESAAALELAMPRFESLQGRDDALRAALDLAQVVTGTQFALGQDTLGTLDVRIRLADRLEDAHQLAESLSALGNAYLSSGARWAGEIFQETAAGLAREHQLSVTLGLILSNLGSARLERDLVASADASREAVSVLARTGVRLNMAVAQLNLATALTNMGRWDELDALLAGARALWESTFNQAGVYCATVAAVDRGLPVPPVPDDLPAAGDGVADKAWVLFESAVLAAAAGDPARGCAEATEAAKELHAVTGTTDDFVWMYGVAGSLAIELDDEDRLRALIDLIDDPERLKPGTRGHYLRVQAMAARGPEPESVEPLLREAADAFVAWGSPLWRARTMADLGVWLGRQGADEEAEEALAAARSTYEELGAAGLLAELDQKLAAVL
ncbi:MAG TPA: adenylate/guanylate cyclase domain-containing protein [Marmoricola sp.]|nr:adenylate/guanylate cyclase domain-containing protein [Marmoricola sp.]